VEGVQKFGYPPIFWEKETRLFQFHYGAIRDFKPVRFSEPVRLKTSESFLIRTKKKKWLFIKTQA
jgi:hypothetical protein